MVRESPHFSYEELRCHCGCGRCDMDVEFMRKLELVRLAYGKPMIPLSGFRCPEHNAAVGGAAGSQHLKGNAIDVVAYGEDAVVLVCLAKQAGMKGFGVYQSKAHNPKFVHLDARETYAVWSE